MNDQHIEYCYWPVVQNICWLIWCPTVAEAEASQSNITKDIRLTCRKENADLQKFFEETEDLLYRPGIIN